MVIFLGQAWRPREPGPNDQQDENLVSTLERAISIAAEAHTGQTDKAGERYILRPLRIMLALSTDEERIVGVLHDVVEDCAGWSFDRLRAEGFPKWWSAG
jgi:(p)ppGpp synthase/HD superfamily hydrolase